MKTRWNYSEMTKRDRNLVSLTPNQILEMDNSIKYSWAKELGYKGEARTKNDMQSIERYILQERENVFRNHSPKKLRKTREECISNTRGNVFPLTRRSGRLD